MAHSKQENLDERGEELPLIGEQEEKEREKSWKNDDYCHWVLFFSLIKNSSLPFFLKKKEVLSDTPRTRRTEKKQVLRPQHQQQVASNNLSRFTAVVVVVVWSKKNHVGPVLLISFFFCSNNCKWVVNYRRDSESATNLVDPSRLHVVVHRLPRGRGKGGGGQTSSVLLQKFRHKPDPIIALFFLFLMYAIHVDGDQPTRSSGV